MAEFAERLVEGLVSGTHAPSRVQKDWDIEGPDGEKIQVKYLANTGSSAGTWVNEHPLVAPVQADSYALVVYEDLKPVAVVKFTLSRLAEVCARLGKRHGQQDKTLQLTRLNYLTFIENREEFENLGVRVWFPPWE